MTANTMTRDAPAALVIDALQKSFGKTRALNGLSLRLPFGEIYGLLGANGAGKTTALRIICGLLKPDGGSGECVGTRLGATPRGIGYMPQRGGLYDDLTVIENLRFFARAHGLAQPSRKADQALAASGLAAQSARRVGTLSGGWRQRVALACALLHSPRLLLLDEPTAGLDPQARQALWQRLRGLAASGVAVLVTTHHVDEAERCDRLGYLDAGCLRVSDSPAAIARALGLSAWRVGVTAAAPPVLSTLVYRRDSEGWRVLSTHPEPPAELIDWLSGQGLDRGLSTSAIEPTLADALDWLALQQGDVHA